MSHIRSASSSGSGLLPLLRRVGVSQPVEILLIGVGLPLPLPPRSKFEEDVAARRIAVDRPVDRMREMNPVDAVEIVDDRLDGLAHERDPKLGRDIEPPLFRARGRSACPRTPLRRRQLDVDLREQHIDVDLALAALAQEDRLLNRVGHAVGKFRPGDES